MPMAYREDARRLAGILDYVDRGLWDLARYAVLGPALRGDATAQASAVPLDA
jgi:hypothetical protein